MKLDYVGRHILRCHLILVFIGLVLIGLAALVFALDQLLWSSPSIAVSSRELAVIEDPEQHWPGKVRFVPDADPIDTGVREFRRGGGEERTTKKYLLVAVEDRWMVVATPPRQEGKEFEGWLMRTNKDDDRDLIRDITRREPGIQKQLLPFKLDCVNHSRDTEEDALPIVASCLMFGIIPFIVGLIWIVRPNWNPIARSLRSRVDATDVPKSLDHEMGGPSVERMGSVRVTPSWLVHQSICNLNLARIEDIVWMYQLYSSKFKSVVIFKLRSGQSFPIRASHAITSQLIDRIRVRIPWARVGNLRELRRYWDEDPEGFIDSVLARRERMKGREPLEPEESPTTNKSTADNNALRPQHDSDYQKGMS
jgi:hypothetical protein